MSTEPLNVIALVSGGKDSLYTALHCLRNGHRVVALANLYPASSGQGSSGGGRSGGNPTGTVAILPGEGPTELDLGPRGPPPPSSSGEADENGSFMYQTAGHAVLPLYAAATGVPLFRGAISRGGARDAGLVYRGPVGGVDGHDDATREDEAEDEDEDETESMTRLVESILASPLLPPHRRPSALCAGALLSTYQRTRVESVAVRLGLAPLAWLWQYPVLPKPVSDPRGSLGGGGVAVPQLLRDMARAGLDARIVRVASAGLDADFLGTSLTDAGGAGARRVAKAVARFAADSGGEEGQGPAEAAALGEGGEFETLVLGGPPALFGGGRIELDESSTQPVPEEGGAAWLWIGGARVVRRDAGEEPDDGLAEIVRVPGMWDDRFNHVLQRLRAAGADEDVAPETTEHDLSSESTAPIITPKALGLPAGTVLRAQSPALECWSVTSDSPSHASVEEEASHLVGQLQAKFASRGLSPSRATLSTVVVLRHMADFLAVNRIYASLFPEPSPPSRVTVSCGDLVPRGRRLVVTLLVQPDGGEHAGGGGGGRRFERDGLHVQSRSYWAPANIGPYSQAVTASLPPPPPPPRSEDGRSSSAAAAGGEEDDDDDLENGADFHHPPPAPIRSVYIAGQIALVPATMALPSAPLPGDASEGAGEEGSLSTQLALALQHLWRVAAATRVGWFAGGAVAYFPRTGGGGGGTQQLSMRDKAVLAGRCWCAAWLFGAPKAGGEQEDEDESATADDGPDLWDRRFDARLATFSSGGGAARSGVPAWSLYDCLESIGTLPVPLSFAAEVAELPRGAAVEWHAQLGVDATGLRDGAVRMLDRLLSGGAGGARMHVLSVRSAGEAGGRGAVLLHAAVVVEWREDGGAKETAEAVGRAMAEVAKGIEELTAGGEGGDGPYLTYVDSALVDETTGSLEGVGNSAVIPCYSLWSSTGERLAAAFMFRAAYDTRR